MKRLGNKSLKKYFIEYLKEVVEQDIPALPKSVREAIGRAIETRLANDPIGFGKPLQYSLKGHRRLMMSEYRIVYRINPDASVVTIIAIKHRKEVHQSQL